MKRLRIALLFLLILRLVSTKAQTYQPNFQSLQQANPEPEWFKDIKFGIYFHWGVFTTPQFGDAWYPHYMYDPTHNEYDHHIQTYGPLNVFPYDKFITGANDLKGNFVQFAPKLKSKGGNWDPNEWAQLFADAGAKFAGPVAEHHDGFSMWASKVNPWNALDNGPKMDLVDSLAKAIRKQNLKLVLTMHHAFNGTGFYDKVPATSDPKLQKLYGQLGTTANDQYYCDKLKEVIDNYQPDILWQDAGLFRISQDKVLEAIAYYYNKSLTWNKEVVVSSKDVLTPQVGVRDYERGGASGILPQAWLTDESNNPSSWSYFNNDVIHYYSSTTVLHELIDVVSKNGNFFFNISPMADGTIPQEQKTLLLQIGSWLKKYGEAIYSTRPWLQYGEGPTQIVSVGQMGSPNAGTYQDFRYTRSKDNKTVYAIMLGWNNGQTEALLTSVTANRLDANTLSSVSLLTPNGATPLTYRQDQAGLHITLPTNYTNDMAYVFKLSIGGATTNVPNIPGIIQSEDFDTGGEGIAYHDNEPANLGGQYRITEGVDIENCGDNGGGYDVGYTIASEWLNYTVNATISGLYNVILRQSGNTTGNLSLKADGVTVIDNHITKMTGGWQNYTNDTLGTVWLSQGFHTLQLGINQSWATNLNYINFSLAATPYKYLTIPGTIQSEDFDIGANGQAYSTGYTTNPGGQYRLNVGVGIENCGEGGYDVGYIGAGNWFNYTAVVTATGSYFMVLRDAGPGGIVSVKVDNVTALSNRSTKTTSGWQSYTNDTLGVLSLSKGIHTIQLYVNTPGMNLNYMSFVPNTTGGQGTTPTTFQNPVISGTAPDPSICRVGDDFYLVNSSFEYFPGLPIYHSRDLVNWEMIGYVLSRPSQNFLNNIKSSEGQVAPTIRYKNGVFYVIGTNVSNGLGAFYVTATNPAGPWSDPKWIGHSFIDPDIFFDDDGTVYTTSPHYCDGYFVQSTLNLQNGTVNNPPVRVADGTGGACAEGPHIYKINGYYYLMAAEGGSGYGHMVTMQRSTSPTGPWTPSPNNPVATNKNDPTNPIQGTGHGDLIQLQDGSWWMVCLGFRPKGGNFHHMGRETYLAPITWDSNGWPKVLPNGIIQGQFPLPNLPVQTWPAEPVRDDFNSTQLRLPWNFVRNPDNNWSLTTKPGYLVLNGTAKNFTQNASPAYVCRRQTSFNMVASTKINFTPTADNEEAGLVLRASDDFHVNLVMTKLNNQKSVVLKSYASGIGTVIYSGPLLDTSCILKVVASDLNYKYYIQYNTGPAQYLGSTLTKDLSTEVIEQTGNWNWTGVFVGMYASGNGKPCANPASFDWFDYQLDSSSTMQPPTYTNTNGTLKDRNGNIMRGFPMAIAKSYVAETQFALNPANWQRLKDSCRNTVRICWIDPWIQDNTTNSIWTMSEVASVLDSLVKIATQKQMNIIINYHNPAEQQNPNGVVSSANVNMARLKSFWTTIAPRYNTNDLVYYEMYNEPVWGDAAYLNNTFMNNSIDVYKTIRTLAPQRRILMFSFHNMDYNFPAIISAYGPNLDWNYTTVAYHMYSTPTSTNVVNLAKTNNVICSEWFYPSSGQGYVVQVDGEALNGQTLERIGHSWVDWRDWYDNTFNHTFNELNPDARAKGYAWCNKSTGGNLPGAAGAISGNNTLCAGQSGLTYSIAAVPGATSYVWTVPAGSIITSGSTSNSITLTIGTAGGTISVNPINSAGSGSGSSLTVSVSAPVNPSVSIVSSATNVCAGDSVSFVATGTNGGSAPSYTWKVNGSTLGTGSTFSFVPTNGQTVSAVLTAGGTLPTCLANITATSSAIALTVNPKQKPSVSVSSTGNTVCSGQTVSLTAIGANVGDSPSYAWFRNGQQVSTGSSFSLIPNNGDSVYAIVTMGGSVSGCNYYYPQLFPYKDFSNGLTGWGNYQGPNGSSATFSLSTTNYYQSPPSLKVDVASLGTNAYDIQSVGPTWNAVPGNSYTLTFYAMAAKPGATLRAIQLNQKYEDHDFALTTVWTKYTWTFIALETAPNLRFNYSFAGNAGNSIYLSNVVISGPNENLSFSSARSNALALSVSSSTPTVSIVASKTSVCSGEQVSFTATSTNAGSAPTYIWKVNGSTQGTGSTFSFVPTNGQTVSAVLTAGGTLPNCLSNTNATSSSVTLTVNPSQTPSVSISSSATSVCSGSQVSFTATGTNGGSAPTYTWKVNGSTQGTGSTFSFMPTNGQTVSAVLTAGGTLPNCLSNTTATSSGVTLTVNPSQTASVSISSSATNVCSGSQVSFTATGTNAGSAPTYTWKVNGSTQGTGSTFSFVPTNGQTVSAVLTAGGTLPNCLANTTATSNSISLTVNSCQLPQPGSISGPSLVATGSTSVTYSVVDNPGVTYNWTVPSGATIVSGQGTNTITVSFGSSPTTGTIGLSETNANGTAQVGLNVSSGAPPAHHIISGPSSVPQNSSNEIYSTATVAGESYQWIVPAGTELVSGQNSGSVGIDFGSSVNGYLKLISTNSFGTQTDSVQVSTMAATGLMNSISGNEVSLYPNPTYRTFNVKISGHYQNAEVTITDDKGVKFFETHELQDLGEDLKPGHYIVTIIYNDKVVHLPFVKLE